jgi:tetratricopeptide (TPR) repeat protein
MRRLLVLIACLVVVSSGVPIGAEAEPGAAREYPSYDQQALAIVSRLERSRQALRLAKERPSDPQTIALLLETEHIDDALAALRQAVAGPADTVVAVLHQLSEKFYLVSRDEPRGYVKTLGPILDIVRGRLSTLPREDAARVARELLTVDQQVSRRGSGGWSDALTAFASTYAGTEAARLAEVDLIEQTVTDIPARIEMLAQYARAHPASVTGAKALYLAGFHLHLNIAVTGVEKAGTDPTPRFLRVLDIYRELRDGGYPPSEWVTRAPELVNGFFVSTLKPTVYAPGNLDVMIDGYRKFVFERFDATDDLKLDDSIGYVLTGKLGNLYALKGDRVAGIEQTLTDLEARAADKNAVRLFRGEFYLRESTAGPADARAAMALRARETLSAVAETDGGYPTRKALAVLAAMALATNDVARARPLYERYVRAYPRSPWSWLAALRIGLTYEAEGKWHEAELAYLKAGTDDPGALLTPVLAAAYAGRAQEAQGEFDAARRSYRRALDAWQPEFGAAITPSPWRVRPPAPQGAPPPVDSTIVGRNDIASRADALDRAARVPGGMSVERGRWQLDQQKWRDAEETLRGFLTSPPGSPLTTRARSLLHHAQLEPLLQAVADPAWDGDAAAHARLEALAAEPADFFVSAATLLKGALRLRDGDRHAALALTTAALDRIISVQRPLVGVPIADPVDADVAAIRRVVFRPYGDLALLSGGHWNAFTFPSTPPAYVVANATVGVKLFGREPMARTIYQEFPDLKNVVFLDRDEQAMLARIVAAVGGTARREPAQVMETPNQPVGVSRDVVSLWNEVFPTRPGHWGGWEFETYPQITRVDFLDEARTKASVMVTVGYSGATIVMEKIAGVWKAIRLTNQWIT